jgi:hypothetical protein
MGESSAQRITRLLLERKAAKQQADAEAAALAAKQEVADAKLARLKSDKKTRQR